MRLLISGMPASLAKLIAASLILLLAPLTSWAGGHSYGSGNSPYVNMGFVVEDWSEAGDIGSGDIQPFGGRSFDETGYGFELGVHVPAGNGRFYWGGTLGVTGHDSNIPGFFTYEELQLSTFYIAPSAKLKMLDGEMFRLFLDAGAGFYSVSIAEYNSYCYYYYCSSYEYYDDDALGGFVGLSGDIDVGRRGGAYINFGVKAHYIDFDAPIELGLNDDLGGPIYQFQIGVGWGT
jgi:hypothetical protein